MTGTDFSDTVNAKKQSDKNEPGLRALLDAIPQLVWTTNTAGKALFFNQQWWNYTGITPEAYLPDSAIMAVHPQDREKLMMVWTEAFSKGTAIEHEYRLRAADGHYRWHLGRVVPVRNSQGEIEQWFGTATDIENQKQASLEFQTLMEAMPSFVWRTNVGGTVDYANRSFTEYTGLSVSELNAKGWASIIHAEDMEQLGMKWNDARAKGIPYQSKFRLLRKDGEYRWVIRHSHPVKDDSGEVMFWLGTTTDIHELSTTAESLEKSESQLKIVTDSLPVLISYLDTELRYRFVNRLYEKWFGNPVDQFIGKHVTEVLGARYVEEMLPKMKLALQGEYQQWEAIGKYEFGDRWIHATYVPDVDRNGKVRGFAVLVTDITERKKTEEARLEAESRFRSFFEQSNLPMEIYSLDGSPAEVNRAWESFFETTRSELEGYNVFADPQLQNTALMEVLKRAAKGESLEIPSTFYDPVLNGKRGRGRWLEGTVFPVKAQGQEEVKELAMILRDVTDREEALKNLKVANEQLEQAVRARQDLLNICGHELKTPLSSLRLQTQTAKRRIAKGDQSIYEPEKVQKLIAMYESQIERLVHLVDDMLDLTRISSGKLTLNLEPVKLSSLILEVLDRFSDQLAAAGCMISTSLEPNVVGQWDRFRIEQVFTNLLTNAMRYGKMAPITVSVKQEQGRALLVVKDQGIGISKENHERIFHRFERAVSANDISGLGLGLFIVKEIVHAHQGEILVESEAGKGAAFIVKLPLIEHGARNG